MGLLVQMPRSELSRAWCGCPACDALSRFAPRTVALEQKMFCEHFLGNTCRLCNGCLFVISLLFSGEVAAFRRHQKP